MTLILKCCLITGFLIFRRYIYCLFQNLNNRKSIAMSKRGIGDVIRIKSQLPVVALISLKGRQF